MLLAFSLEAFLLWRLIKQLLTIGMDHTATPGNTLIKHILSTRLHSWKVILGDILLPSLEKEIKDKTEQMDIQIFKQVQRVCLWRKMRPQILQMITIESMHGMMNKTNTATMKNGITKLSQLLKVRTLRTKTMLKW